MFNHRLLFCQGPKPEHFTDPEWEDKYYISARVLGLVRPGIDVIVLPGDNAEVRSFANFIARVIGLEGWQILYTTGQNYLLDADIGYELILTISKLFAEHSGQWLLAPYCGNAAFNYWASRYFPNISVLADDEEWADRMADKGILHPNAIPERRNVLMPYIGHLAQAVTPRGYTCDSKDELLLGAEMLHKAGIERLILKPRFTSAGFGTFFPTQAELEAYNFPEGGVVLEEVLNFQGVSSIQFYGTKLLPCPTDQLVRGAVFDGNIVPSRQPIEFQRQLMQAAQSVLDYIQPKGLGAFDFLDVDGVPYLVDPNLGRWTGGWISRWFHQIHAAWMVYQAWKIHPPSELSVDKYWKRLVSAGVAFIPGSNKPGVFPLCFLSGMWSMLIAFGHNHEELPSLVSEAERLLT